jgi:hypothetical protein
MPADRTFMGDTYKVSVSSKKRILIKSFSESHVPYVGFPEATNERLRIVYPLLTEIVSNPFGKSVYPEHLGESYTYIVSFKKDFLRFAVLAKTAQAGISERDVSIAPVAEHSVLSKGSVSAAIARNGVLFEARVPWHSVSEEFFNAPAPENARTIGDLCFLTQAKKGWKIHSKITTPYSNREMGIQDVYGLYSAMRLLLIAPGFDDLIKTANVQLLLANEGTWEPAFWRMLATYADGLKTQGSAKAENRANRIFETEQKRRR